MQLQAGSLLQSTDILKGTFFENSIIFLTEYNAAGAVGFVVNKIFHRPLNELEEFKHSPSFPLYEGGPVDTTHLYFIHRRPDIIDAGIAISNGVYYSGDFKQAVTAINNRSIGTADLKIFIGYCGWNAGELEAELAEGSWSMLHELNIFNI